MGLHAGIEGGIWDLSALHTLVSRATDFPRFVCGGCRFLWAAWKPDIDVNGASGCIRCVVLDDLFTLLWK